MKISLKKFGCVVAVFLFASDGFAETTSSQIVLVTRGSNPCLITPAMQQSIYQFHFSSTPGLMSAKFKECYDAQKVKNPTNNPNGGWTAIYKGLVTVQ